MSNEIDEDETVALGGPIWEACVGATLDAHSAAFALLPDYFAKLDVALDVIRDTLTTIEANTRRTRQAEDSRRIAELAFVDKIEARYKPEQLLKLATDYLKANDIAPSEMLARYFHAPERIAIWRAFLIQGLKGKAGSYDITTTTQPKE